MGITDNIEMSPGYNEIYHQSWNFVRPLIEKEDEYYSEKEITPVEAKKYEFDLYSIFNMFLR